MKYENVGLCVLLFIGFRLSTTYFFLLLGVDLGSLGAGEGDVDDGGTGDDVVVSDRVADLGDDHVDAAVADTLGDGDGVAVADLGVEDLETGKEGGVLTGLNTITGDSHLLATADIARDLGTGEGLDGKSRIGVGARLDQRRSERVGLVEVKRRAGVTRESIAVKNRRGYPSRMA